MTLINLMDQGKRIINVDETWLNATSFIRKLWASRGGTGNMNLNLITPRVSMIAALDTCGNVWFSLTHSTTDSDMIALFFM